MASLLDITGQTLDPDAFEEVGEILFHGEAGFLAPAMEKNLSCLLLIELSLSKASLWCLSLPTLDVHVLRHSV